jgi:hypothetical protein
MDGLLLINVLKLGGNSLLTWTISHVYFCLSLLFGHDNMSIFTNSKPLCCLRVPPGCSLVVKRVHYYNSIMQDIYKYPHSPHLVGSYPTARGA